MTLFFDLAKLEKLTQDNPKTFITLLRDLYNKKLFNKVNTLHGNSFILNPEYLFTSTVDIGYLIQYIKLAARRDYTLYKHYGTKTLLLSFYPDINLEAIKTNPLLKITESEIYFLYEEQQGIKKIWH